MKQLKVLFALLVLFFASVANATVINEIEVKNNQRIEESTILSYVEIKEGEKFSQEKANSSVKKMFATGLFSDVNVTVKGSTLIIDVEENPIINKIVFEGNKRVGEKNLLSEIELEPRAVYTRAKVQRDTRKIQNIYRKSGRFSVSVEPKVVKLEQNRVNLIFEIDEGKKATVGKIIFIGNKYFDDEKLQKIINTKESRWYSFYSGNDTYDTDRVAFDKELLRKFYTSKGYADFKVVATSAEITKDKKSFVLTFTVLEGDKYIFGESEIQSSLPGVQAEKINDVIRTKKGEEFDARLIDDTVEDITDRLNDLGYAFVEVGTQYMRDEEKDIMGIVYNVSEGPKVYIDNIHIGGNVRTLDRVIRREFRIAEGDPYNAAKIRRSQQRINNLGFFSKVDLDSERSDEYDKADILVNVKEKSTGELSFGAGFSTNDGALGNVSIRERNLLGRGQDLRVSFQKSARLSQIDLGFTEPYFMGKDISAGFDIFDIANNYEDESSFESKSQGGALRASYSLTEHLRHSVKYSIKQVEVNNVNGTVSTFIREQEGENTTSSIGHSFLYDKRDNRFEPTDGYYIRFAQDFAGLGGDSQFFKNEVSGGYYKPIYREDVILSLSGRAGNIAGWGDKDVRIDERFFIGGTSLRGFKNSGIGPRDDTTRDSLGGNSYYVLTGEVFFPLGLPDELGFKGSTFIDAGSLFDVDSSGSNILDDNSIRGAAGVGISWTSPLGPIRVDIAQPFASESYDKTQNVRFNFGTRF